MLINKEKRIQYLGFNDFWFSVIGILIVSFVGNYLFNDLSERNSFSLVLIGWSVTLMYSIYDWLIIRAVLILLRKKYPDFKDDIKRTTIFFITIVCVVICVDYLGGIIFTTIINSFDGYNSSHTTRLSQILPIVILVTLIMAIYEAVYYSVRLKKSVREEEQTKQVMIQAQLDTLRNQAQPHFLFNSLNTLRDIIDQDTKEDAKSFVDNLSGVYRFIIESGNSNLITLEEELKFAKAYGHIQLERFGDNLKVNWNIPEQKLTSRIVPMSLQLLLENAIKHNVVSKTKPLIVDVVINNDHLVVRNKIQVKSTQIPSTKIGLKNIEKRYALISGKLPTIINDGDTFTVSLPLLTLSDQKKEYENTNH